MDRSPLALLTFLWGGWGEPYGVEYVTRLHDACKRQLSRPFRFFVLTDRDDIPDGIHAIPLKHPERPGCMPKLEMFRPDMPFKGRVLAIDLDTIITGELDEISAYDGDFCVLEDFFQPGHHGGGIVGFEAGAKTWLWDRIEHEPNNVIELTRAPGGVGSEKGGSERMFYRFFVPECDYWQRLYPGKITSFKVEGYTDKASVVCFHGSPRPHECRSDWLEKHWGPPLEGSHVIPYPRNALPHDVLERNLRENCAREPKHFLGTEKKLDKGKIAIVGGGPTLAENLRALKSFDGPILAINGTGHYLESKGIRPWGVFVLDPRDDNIRFVSPPIRDVKYFLAGTCDPSLFDALRKKDVTAVHFDVFPNQRAVLDELNVPAVTIGGGSAAGHRATYFATVMGFSEIHLFGVDCSLKETDGRLQHHSYKQNLRNVGLESVLNVTCDGKQFLSTGWMYSQAREFAESLSRLPAIKAHGDSLLKTIVDSHNERTAA